MILIKNGLIITDADSAPRSGNIIIQNGLIKEIITSMPVETDHFIQIIDAENKIIIPGLINGHTHSYGNFVKVLVENLPLETMMFHIMAQGAALTPEDVFYNTLLGAMEMLKNGITSCFDQLAQDFEGLDAAMQAYDRIGMRATIAPMITDKKYYDTLPVSPELKPKGMQPSSVATPDKLIETSIKFLRKWQNKKGRLRVAFGPSGPQRCSDQLLKKCMEAAIEYDTVFHTHVLETKIQADTAYYLYGKSMVKHLDKIGCLNERTSMAHTVWMSREEAVLARDNGAMVVHCPGCNLNIGSGVAPVNMFIELGLPIGLGTDGANCGGNQNMLETMKIAAILHRNSERDRRKWLSARDVFKMSTANNARITRQQNVLGSIETGKKADLVILDPAKSCSMQPLQHPIRQIVYGETGQAVDTVLVEGQVVLEKGTLTLVDEKEIYAKANQMAKAVEAMLQKQQPVIDKQITFLESILPRR